MRIGFFGGSFNPPHMGHVLAAHYALLRWGLDKLVVMPSFKHPFNKAVVAYDHRVRMAELAFAHLGNWIEISRLEEELGGVSYTVDVIRELKRRNPAWNLHLVIGGDIVGEMSQWREADALKEIAPPLVIPRIKAGVVLGGESAGAALPDVSSTEVRETLGTGAHRALERLDGVVPRSVLEYVAQQALYR